MNSIRRWMLTTTWAMFLVLCFGPRPTDGFVATTFIGRSPTEKRCQDHRIWKRQEGRTNHPCTRILSFRSQHTQLLDNRSTDSTEGHAKDHSDADGHAHSPTIGGIRTQRRHLFESALSGWALLTATPPASHARGLVAFPCEQGLANTYHLVRAGSTLLEEDGMWSTNPLFLTNRDDALSERGVEEVVQATQILQRDPPTLVKYSLAASAIDTANIVGRELKLGRDRLVPEFTFLDPRAIGAWDLSDRTVTGPAVWAMDEDEAGRDGLGARPPPNEDGTPHEVLADQAIRLRQVLSILESQYSGDTILLIFPDGTGPALLSAMIAGIPYHRVHELEFGPGETRLNVNYQTTRALWELKKKGAEAQAYQATLARGRENLRELRKTGQSGGAVVNLKDQKLEEERVEIDKVMELKEQRRLAEVETEQKLRRERQVEVVGDGSPPVPSSALGAMAVAGTIGLGLSAALSSASEPESTPMSTNSTMGEMPLVEANPGDVKNTPGKDLPVPEGPVLDLSTANTSPEANTRYATVGATRQNVNSDGSDGTVLQKYIDPEEAAKQAMDAYMEQDDGADDWLLSLSDIIDESNEQPGMDELHP